MENQTVSTVECEEKVSAAYADGFNRGGDKDRLKSKFQSGLAVGLGFGVIITAAVFYHFGVAIV